MKVNGKEYRTVWMKDGTVFYIEQNRLPFEFVINKAATWQECCITIRSMQIRGAGAIGAMAGFAMALASISASRDAVRGISGDHSQDTYSTLLRAARAEIEATRPTARNLFYATELVFNSALQSSQDAVIEAQRVADRDADDSRRIGEFGNSLIRNGARILTHCNAGWLAFVDFGTALSPVYKAHQSGKKVFVYVDETRPRSQGARLTAWELFQEGVPHVIIPDNAGASLMAQGKVDMVITGADRIAANGDTANKIGTLEKAVVAHEFGIPFYIAAPTSTFDLACASGKDIVIEERDEEEVLFQEGPDADGVMHRIRVCSPGSHALNPAFDVTPAKYITGFITERGIIPATPKSPEGDLPPSP
ncbi:MAG: S-methyl-5-thioribose-1-phosphate isomerase [Bacteroidales bacterium]|nr:S-methyl-5-thioribose-1-phosphate isomerase [Bacteroidales bacterium]